MKRDSKISGLRTWSAGPLKRTSRTFGQGKKPPGEFTQEELETRAFATAGNRVLKKGQVMALVGETLQKIGYEEIRKRPPLIRRPASRGCWWVGGWARRPAGRQSVRRMRR